MRFKQFEIRQCTFIGDPPTPDYHKWNFDLVKWNEWSNSGNESYFVIGTLRYNRRESCFQFESCGLRYLANREDGLEEWLMKWCELKELEYRYSDDD